jgi:hypothetical protein
MEPFEMKNNYERLAMKSYSYRKECTVWAKTLVQY